METNKKNTNFESIPKPLNRDNINKVILWLTKKDLFVAIGSILISGFIWLPLFLVGYKLISLIVLFLSLLFTGLLIFPFLDKTTRIYKIVWRSIRNASVKKVFIGVSKKDNDLIVKKQNNKNKEIVNYIKIFKLAGVDTELLDEITQMSLYNNLANFFENQNENNFFDLIKIEQNTIYGNPKIQSNNPVISKFIDENNEICKEFSQNNTKKAKKLILVVYSNKESNLDSYINQLNQILKISRINMIKASDDEINYVREKIWNENSYLENNSRFLSKTSNNSSKDKEFVKILAINSLPKVVGREWLYSLFNIDDIDVVIKSSVYDERESKKLLDRAIAAARDETRKNKSSAAQMEEDLLNYHILSDIAESVAKTNAKFLSNHILIIIRADSKKELLIKSKDLSFELKQIGCFADTFINNQLEANQSINFKNKNIDKDISYEILSLTMGFGFPFYPYAQNDQNSFVLGTDENKNLVAIDWSKNLESEQNSNIILQGMSGGGKTTTAKEIMMSQIASKKFKTFIIDPENEYSKLIKDSGGEIIDLGSKNHFINPFHFMETEGFTLDQQLNNNEIFLKIILEESWNVKFKTILMQSCGDLYLKNNNEFTFSDLYKYIKEKYPEAKDLHDLIQLYTKKGTLGKFWDKKTNIEINNDVICFNFLEITNAYSSSYKHAKTFLLLKFLENKVIENRTSKDNKLVSIFIDEGHLFTSEKMYETLLFIFNWFKRIRKYKGMICFITQNINDLLGNKQLNHLTTAIVNNSFYWLILKMTSNEIRQLDNLLTDLGGLSDAEKEYLVRATAGQSILFTENTRSKIQIFKKIN